MNNFLFKTFLPYLLAVAGICFLTVGMSALHTQINPITVSLAFLLFILFIATFRGSKPAIFASVIAMFCLNFFFLPPFHNLMIADPQNWIALFAFLAVSLTAGQLSAKSKNRAEEAERLYQELQEAFEKASQAEAFKQSEKLKSALLDAVTHDLRTPLTSIKASVTMLLEESQADPIHLTLEPQGREELLEIINEETDRLNNFVESMVEIARIEGGDFHLRKTPTEVEEIVANALHRAENLLSAHQTQVRIESRTPKIWVDSRSISEVVYNLIDNAVKYSPPDSLITISAKAAADIVEISVEDEGAGVAIEERDRIFQKFYRSNKSTGGFGMGLAIARGIIESHGGKIRVETGNVGSRFVFELPIN